MAAIDLGKVVGEQGPQGEKGIQGERGLQGPQGVKGDTGDNGATFTPSVSSDGVLSWTNDKQMENPESFDIVAAVLAVLPNANVTEY